MRVTVDLRQRRLQDQRRVELSLSRSRLLVLEPFGLAVAIVEPGDTLSARMLMTNQL
jgi:hypothetical protein